MPITVVCGSCANRLTAPDSAAGRRAKCPKCAATVEIPAAGTSIVSRPSTELARRVQATPVVVSPNSPNQLAKAATAIVPANPVATSPITIDVRLQPPTPPFAPTEPPAPQTKACDFCGETILATAKKCKHCGEILDLALRASQTPTPQFVAQPAAIQITNVNTNVVGHAPVKRWSPFVAFILSFLIPGLGQCYKGQVINGIVWFIVVVIGYVMLIVPGVVLHICCAIGASLGDPYR